LLTSQLVNSHLQLTNAGKIFFTIFTALKKTNHLFFRLQPVLRRDRKKKETGQSTPGCFPHENGDGEKQIFFK
jgi:hypothetical protein